jgi:hypothetical protein
MQLRKMLPMLLAFASAACVAGVLSSLLFGVIGATDDTSSSWSDPEPRRMIWRAVALGILALVSSIAAVVIHRRTAARADEGAAAPTWQARSARAAARSRTGESMNVLFRTTALLCVAIGAFFVFGVVEALGSVGGARAGGAVAGVVLAALLGFAAVKLWRAADERSDSSRI